MLEPHIAPQLPPARDPLRWLPPALLLLVLACTACTAVLGA